MYSSRLRPAMVALLLLLCGSPARAAEAGFTLAGATAQADVFLDGEKIGTTPLPGVVPCPVGEHTIRVSRPGYAPYIDVFKVRDGKVTKIDVELVPVSGVLRLSASVDQARVFIDGQFAGDAPLETELKIGPHKVRVTRFGYEEDAFTVNAVAGQVFEKQVRLRELPDALNPYKRRPPPPKWYERWWVWAAGAGGVAALAVAVIVPTALSVRSPCDKIGGDLCIPVPAAADGQLLLVGGRF